MGIWQIDVSKAKISVIFVGDKQNEYSLHHLSCKKNEEKSLFPLENIEFF